MVTKCSPVCPDCSGHLVFWWRHSKILTRLAGTRRRNAKRMRFIPACRNKAHVPCFIGESKSSWARSIAAAAAAPPAKMRHGTVPHARFRCHVRPHSHKFNGGPPEVMGFTAIPRANTMLSHSSRPSRSDQRREKHALSQHVSDAGLAVDRRALGGQLRDVTIERAFRHTQLP